MVGLDLSYWEKKQICDYANNVADNLVSYTSTWRPPTKEACEKMIIKFAKLYSTRKWYQYKKPFLDELKDWTNNLIMIEKHK